MGSRSPPIGFHQPVGLHHELLGDDKWFCLHPHLLLESPVGYGQDHPTSPLRSIAITATFITTTSDSVPVPRIGTQVLVGSPLERLPSHRDDWFPQFRRKACQWQPKTAHLWQPKTAHFWGGRLGRSGHSPGDARRACWAGRRERSDRSPGQHAPRSCRAGGHVATPSRCSSDAVLSQC